MVLPIATFPLMNVVFGVSASRIQNQHVTPCFITHLVSFSEQIAFFFPYLACYGGRLLLLCRYGITLTRADTVPTAFEIEGEEVTCTATMSTPVDGWTVGENT